MYCHSTQTGPWRQFAMAHRALHANEVVLWAAPVYVLDMWDISEWPHEAVHIFQAKTHSHVLAGRSRLVRCEFDAAAIELRPVGIAERQGGDT